MEAEPEQPKEEEKVEPISALKKGPRPKGTKRFKKMALEEPERDEEVELSNHQKKKSDNARKKAEELELQKKLKE